MVKTSVVNLNNPNILTVNNDTTIGEDSTDLMVVNSDTKFTGNVDAKNGLDVTGAALTINQAITQTGSGQVTFTGNVDATNGLDVTNAALTINQAITQTGTNANTLTGPTTLNNTLNINGDVNIEGKIKGDVVIGEDDSEMLTIASKINVNGNEKTLLNKPVAADKGKIVTVNDTGDDLQYGPQVLKHNMNYKNITEVGTINNISSSTANDNPVEHTPMNITITPQSATSKVMISVNIMGEWSANPENGLAYLKKTINGVSTDLVPPVDGNRNRGLGHFVLSHRNDNAHTMEVCNFHYIDEPNTTDEVGYQVMLVNASTNQDFYYNRTKDHDNSGANTRERGFSFISAEEKFANDDNSVGAITSFTQEQALAGAGGTAAFTAYHSTTYGIPYDDIADLTNNIISEDPDDYFILQGIPGYVSFEFTTPQIITKYRIWGRGESGHTDPPQNPKDWQLRAAVDKATYDSGTYTLLDSQTGESFTPYSAENLVASDNLSMANEYNLSTIGAYKYYYFHITGNNGHANLISMSELALYGGGFTIPSQIGNGGKQLITNGTSLSWGSPASILVPSPTGNANKVLQANSAGNALEYSNTLNINTLNIGDQPSAPPANTILRVKGGMYIDGFTGIRIPRYDQYNSPGYREWNIKNHLSTNSLNYLFSLDASSSTKHRLNANGNGQWAGTISANFNLSDDRLKTNEAYLENATTSLLKLSVQTYDKEKINNFSLLERTGKKVRETGLIAQEVYYNAPEFRHLINCGTDYDDDEYPEGKDVIPDEMDLSGVPIGEDPDYEGAGWSKTDMASIEYQSFVAYLIKSTQELHERILKLEDKINNM